MLARIAGGPGITRVDGVERGEATLLNTREFRYATYIVRVLRAIAANDKGPEQYLMRDPGFEMYPVRDWRTAIEITLDETGAVERVDVRSPSGLDFVDYELVRAVRNAGPFPNPPAGLRGPDGKIRLAQRWSLDAEMLRRRVAAATGRP
jgi:TonB family protein